MRNRIQLVIAGTGPITECLRREGKDLPIPPIIDFLPDAELAEWRHRADLYVHTSELAEQFSFRRTVAETLEMYRECISIFRESFAHVN